LLISLIQKFVGNEIPKRVPDEEFEKIDPVIVGALLEFQREGVSFGISRGGRVLIADDMGLGLYLILF